MADWSELKQKAQAAADEFGSYDPAEAEIEFMSAITPAIVLALIAESERLQAERDAIAKSQRYGQDAVAIAVERDQLRAEVEALRKDAERYQWLRARNSGPIGIIAYAIEPENEMDLVEDKADAAIDAAMGKDNPA